MSLKNKLNKQHINHRTACNGQERLTLPKMQQNNGNYRKNFRQSMIHSKQIHPFKTIHDSFELPVIGTQTVNNTFQSIACKTTFFKEGGEIFFKSSCNFIKKVL